jgi:anti-sigma factor RsiW
MLDSDRCPDDPEKVAEAYLLHRLPADEQRIFEDHYMTCARCARIVETTAAFIGAVRRAAKGAGREG